MDKFKQKLTKDYDGRLKEFYINFAKDYLKYLGNDNPTFRQLREVQFLLSQVWIQRTICIDGRLTNREQQCLYLSAMGKTIKLRHEVAEAGCLH